MPIVIARCQERELALSRSDSLPKYNDCTQWLLESAPSRIQRTPKGVAHELMAIWFAAFHPISVTITYALQDLILHPSYLDPIRAEIFDSAQAVHFLKTGTGFPLLDSFIKESARLSPVESQSVRRRSVEPFALSDGTQLKPGDWACTPVTSMMRDAKWYPSPEEFSGFRFAPKELVESRGMEGKPRQERSSVFVDGDETYMWGVGKNGCPGRYYASTLAKIVIGYLVTKYGMDLVDKEQKRWWTWRTTTVPCEDVMVVSGEDGIMGKAWILVRRWEARGVNGNGNGGLWSIPGGVDQVVWW
jgi:cytochrome P450